MISHDEAIQQNHEKLVELMEKIRSLEIKLVEAEKQEMDWRKIVTQNKNHLNDVKREARELSIKLFGEEKSVGYPVND
ncbi:hypothetical protein [Paenibacillus elgii]|uniref:hypothetical protein n=1 Tax=Paenibacillus elgii TaxID=189691 RepID=UPI000248D22C|nr:hypothetical protein [Paenibacillus elgii]